MLLVQIVELWGRILKILRATTAMRDLVRTVEAVIEHAPVMRPEGAVKEALSDWKRITLLWLGPSKPDKLGAESTLSAVEYQLLCRNRASVVSLPALHSGCVCWSHASLHGKRVVDGVQNWCFTFRLINICLRAMGGISIIIHQQFM